MYVFPYACMYVCMHMERKREVGMSMHGLSCISTHIDPRQSARPLFAYLPGATAARGPHLSALRPRPAPIVAAADRCHECALRHGPARPSLQRAADERAAKDTGVLTVVLCYVLATGYCEYSHGVLLSTHGGTLLRPGHGVL
jgi:hypothetical protein